MSIYAIGDLHLSFGTNKPMNIFGDHWQNYEEKLEKNWNEIIKEDDVVLIPRRFFLGYISGRYFTRFSIFK